ncbi:hypothetical protein FSW04_01655 [Baekduia soli]|uniref:Uncharacterized protein n=1 Tax=Baekduia soli TaxID=496014 RepID=A0A5B8U0B5_9ACTN|nr:hypothetical protein [Baekduia soli]QEC46410.1 hypothetical protein FSW04_01655 [Baekduia soli]
MPFHYGCWDTDHPEGPGGDDGRAANELTPTTWDPVSRQPLSKPGAVLVQRLGWGCGGGPTRRSIRRPR